MHTVLKCFALPHLLHFYHMLGTASVGALCHSIHCYLIITSPLYLSILTCFCLCLLIEAKYFASLIMSNTSFWTLCAYTFWAQIKTCSLFTSLVSFRVINYFIIWAMMVSSFSPFMNCSVNLLSYSWYLHSVALICSLPIQPCADTSLLLFSLQYCSDNIFSLYCVKTVLLLFFHTSFFSTCECLY